MPRRRKVNYEQEAIYPLRNEYAFFELDVLRKTKAKNRYVNLTSKIPDEEPTYYYVDSEDEFLLGLSCNVSVADESVMCGLAPVSLEDLLVLARFSSPQFMSRIHTGVDEATFKDVVATISAKKIQEYTRGKVVRTKGDSDTEDEIEYEFYRCAYVKGKHISKPILSKMFRLVRGISLREVPNE